MTLEPHGGPGWRDMVALRRSVLRLPLGLDFAPDQLASEDAFLHLALRLDGLVCGTLLLVRPDRAGDGRLRQMAVRADLRGLGLGARLMAEGERRLADAGAVSARLHARCTASGFYARHGWQGEGEPFAEIGLPHVLMRKRLRPGDPAS